jgi:H+/Cl- antiporter ClcA
MILGIAAIPLVCCCGLGVPAGIAGAVVSWLGLQKANQGRATNRGQAMAGLICGGIAAVLGIISWVILLATGHWEVWSTNFS